jgi:hypothetical protein
MAGDHRGRGTAMSARLLVQRLALAVTAIGSGMLAAWILVAPRSFYDDFPGAGHHWVSADGPYNEHLLRDVGALSLALTVTVVAALIVRTNAAVRTAGLAGIAFGLPHLVYHAAHLDLFSAGDGAAEMASLALLVLAPAIALVTTFGAAEQPVLS